MDNVLINIVEETPDIVSIDVDSTTEEITVTVLESTPDVDIQISETVNNINIDALSTIENINIEVSTGDSDGGNYNLGEDWMALVRGYAVTPTLNTTIPTGRVFDYEYSTNASNIIYYRFIATDGSLDAFYQSFDGTNLADLITTKQITL